MITLVSSSTELSSSLPPSSAMSTFSTAGACMVSVSGEPSSSSSSDESKQYKLPAEKSSVTVRALLGEDTDDAVVLPDFSPLERPGAMDLSSEVGCSSVVCNISYADILVPTVFQSS